MYARSTVAAVVPAYNESEFVGEVIENLPEYVDCAYVVDDGSSDDTWAVIQRYTGEQRGTQVAVAAADGGVEPDTRIEAIRHDENRGVGGAIKTGYKHALDDEMDVTVVVAGDGQMEPDVVEDVVGAVAKGEADYAKGDRLQPDLRDGMPAFRQLGNYLLSGLTKVSSGYWHVMDPQNGCAAISQSALEAVDIDDLYEDYGFANDLLVRLNEQDLLVADVPQRAIYKEEESQIRYRTFVPKLSVLLLRNFLRRLHREYLVDDFHPLVGLYALGITSAGTGLLWLLDSIVDRQDSGESVNVLVLTAVGLLSVLLAMSFDLEENRELVARPPNEGEAK